MSDDNKPTVDAVNADIIASASDTTMHQRRGIRV
jgi:hypothetical protein